MKKGFTLIELMIVVFLIIMFSALTLPMGFSFFQETTLKDQVRNLENSLRKAQAMAITGRGDSSAGVKITQNKYIIFEGESYENRREETDITIPFSINLSVSEADEIVFQKSTGLPTFPEEEKSIIITFGNNSQEININSQGKIEIVKGIGTACYSDRECGSGYCVEGVCCDTACSGTCQSCVASKTGGSDGTCANVPDGYYLIDSDLSVYCWNSGANFRMWPRPQSCSGSNNNHVLTWGGYGVDNPDNSCTGDGSGYPACDYCDNLSWKGYTDWYLPTLSQLQDLWINKSNYSISYTASTYWSSAESSSNYAYSVYFGNGGTHVTSKNVIVYVRCIRGQ